MKRRKAREYALQMLYQAEFSGGPPESRLFWREHEDAPPEVREFAEGIVRGTLAHLAELDGVIQETAEHWVLDRMPAVDRNLLRAAAYELLHRPDVPTAVVINEALEIGKKFSSAEAAAFINGILDRIARSRRGRGGGEGAA